MIALLVAHRRRVRRCASSRTPALIRVLRAKGIGQQIRDDGPFAHPHETKAGTPTMGGIAIVVGALVGYLVAHVRTEQTKFARTGITLMALIVGMAIVGFVDDYLGVRRGRNLGLRKRGKTGGQLIVAVGFALLALNCVQRVDAPVVHARRSTSTSAPSAVVRLGGRLWSTAFSNAVNITDGLDGLAAGSAAMVFAAFVIIAFWQFRHPDVYHVLPAGVARPRHRVAAAMLGACVGLPVVERRAGAGVHGRRRARSRSAAAMAGLALLTNTILLLPILGGLYVVETLSGDRAGDLVPRLRPPGAAHVADPPPLRGRRAGPSSP